MHGDHALLQRDRPDQVQEEGLAGAVLTDDEPAARPAVGDPGEIDEHRAHLGDPSHLHVSLADLGDDPGAQRSHDHIPLPLPDAITGRRWRGRGHRSSSWSTWLLITRSPSPSQTGSPAVSMAASLSRSTAPFGRTPYRAASAAKSVRAHDARVPSSRSRSRCAGSRSVAPSGPAVAAGAPPIGSSSTKMAASSVPTAVVSVIFRLIAAWLSGTPPAAAGDPSAVGDTAAHGRAWPGSARPPRRATTGSSAWRWLARSGDPPPMLRWCRRRITSSVSRPSMR